MRILTLNTDYPGFLSDLYNRTPGLERRSYAEQMQHRNDSLFGVADFYSRNFALRGHIATDIHANNPWLQAAWAREHGFDSSFAPVRTAIADDSPMIAALKRRLRGYRNVIAPIGKLLGVVNRLSGPLRRVLLAQVEDFNPDVIFNMDIDLIDADLIGRMRKKGCVILAYCGIDPPGRLNPRVYDLGLSMLDWVVESFRKRGLRAEKAHLAFEETILQRLGPQPYRDIGVSFVGSLSANHGRRIALLEAVAKKFPLEVWLPSLSGLSPNSPLRKCHRGAAFGRDLYDIMRRSRMTLNTHVDVARGQAANMRHFEATGVGSFLLTDNTHKLSDLFVPEAEVATYVSVDDALAKIDHFLKHEAARNEVSRAGQARTLRAHTYRLRTAQLLDLVTSGA